MRAISEKYRVTQRTRSIGSTHATFLSFYFLIVHILEFDECARDDHGCEHLCINQLGTYECQCKIGYELHSDGKRCEGKTAFILLNLLSAQQQLKWDRWVATNQRRAF